MLFEKAKNGEVTLELDTREDLEKLLDIINRVRRP
jgi:hypothetical protein